MSNNKLSPSIEKIFSIFVLVLLASCIYEPIDIYENPVNNHPTEPQINILELNVNADTLWVYGNQNLIYHFKSTNEEQRILGLDIYIDGVIRDSVLSDNGVFNILQSSLSEGIHKMTILLYVKSGTGSIADRLEAEALLLSKEWVVIADYSPKKVSHSIENGYLKLHWDSYKNPDLKSYRILPSGSTENNFFVDSSYYGARKRFNISVEKTNGDLITWGFLDMEENIPIAEFKISDNNTYYFTWTQSPFYNTVKYRYKLNNYDDDSRPYGSYTGFKSGSDTVYVSNMHFSDRFYFTLHTLPKNANESTNDFMSYPHSHMMQYAGEPANIRNSTSFTSADTLTAFDENIVYKYFLGGETVLEDAIIPGHSSFLSPIQISPLGQYLIGIVNNSSGDDLKYFAKDLSTGDLYYMDYVTPGFIYNEYLNMRITDNGIGFFQTDTSEFSYDFRQNKKIASRTLSSPRGYFYTYRISPDGKHVMTTNLADEVIVEVYNIEGPNFNKMFSFDSNVAKWQFDPTDPNIITSVNGNTLSVIQCEPYALVRQIVFASDEEFMNIDYFNNEVLTINANQFIIRSLDSGDEIKRISKRQEQYYLYETFRLHNHYILKDNVMLQTQ